MNYGDLEVAIVNPRGDNMASTKRNKKGQFMKRGKGGGKGKRKSNPRRSSSSSSSSTDAGGHKKRRRPRRPGRRRGRRRANPRSSGVPFSSQGMWPIKGTNWADVIPMISNKALVALAVKRWGNKSGGLMGPEQTSDFVGRSWTFRDYAIGFGVSFLGAKLVASRFGRQWGELFWLQGIADMGARMLWTEAFARSKMLKEWFGAYDDPAAQMAVLSQMDGYGREQLVPGYGNLAPGAVMDTPSGRFMLNQHGQMVAMQGSLVQASRQYDGSLVAANARYDGVVQASRRYDGYGHAIGTPSKRARYQYTGSRNAYSTVYQQTA